MKISKSNLKISAYTIISLFLGIFLWDKITLPYLNPHNVYGVLSIEKYNPFSNDLKFIIFISLIFLTFGLSLIYYKKNLNSFKEIIFFEKRKDEYERYNYLNLIFIIFIVFVTFEFLSMSYPLVEIDFFHEGERLGPAKNFLINGKIWSGSLFIHGAFTDLFGPVAGWKIFGKETIGAYRLFLLILTFFTKLVLLILTFKISKLIKSDENTKIVYFALISITILQLTEYAFGNAGRYINYRELPVLFFLIFSIEAVLKKNKNFYGFLIGILSSLSVMFLVDRGIYINVVIIFLLFYFLIRKEFKIASIIFCGSILSWIVIYFAIGSNEFNFFAKDTLHYLSIKGFLDSYIYPTPFIAGEFFSTRGIILVVVAGLLTIYSLLIKNNKQDNSVIFYFFIIFLFSVLTYKNALGRVDVNHVRYSTSYSIVLIALIIWRSISYTIAEKLKFYNISPKFVVIFASILFLSILIINNSLLKGKHLPNSFKNVISLKYRIQQYIQLSDKIFVNPKMLPVINYYKKISKEDECVQSFTNEAVWTYLTKKQMCTRHYILWYAASDKLQKNFISELSNSNAKYLLVNAPLSYGGSGKLWIDNIDYEKRHPIIYKHLYENFEFFENVGGWIFFKKKQ